MSDKIKPGTDVWNKRQAIWRHNAFLGSAKMMQMQTNSIIMSETASLETKELAKKINMLAIELTESLRKRRWP